MLLCKTHEGWQVWIKYQVHIVDFKQTQFNMTDLKLGNERILTLLQSGEVQASLVVFQMLNNL